VDRAGSGVVVESYPATALKQWRFAHTRYKGAANIEARIEIVTELDQYDGLDLGCWRTLCIASDHALDAVLCALVAKAAVDHKTLLPTDAQLATAQVEGWIAVPTCSLEDLLTNR
jgi:hypothetical protein